MNVEAVNELILNNPRLAPAREKLQEMHPGRYCVHQSWGFGFIKDYRPAENRLILDFADKKDHSMDPAFCINTMEILPEKHLLARQQTEPGVIEEMIAKKPVDLVIEALTVYPNHAATGQELENLFRSLLGEARFRRWWTGVKKALAQDPRIHAPAKKTECYFIREEPVEVHQEILDRFRQTQSAKRKIGLAEELVKDSSFDEKSREDYSEVLASLTTTVRDSNQLSLTERLHGAWIRDDLAGMIGTSDDSEAESVPLEPSPASLISDTHDLNAIADELSVGSQKRFLLLVKETHVADWREIIFDLLKESKGKFTTESINFLLENDCQKELSATLSRWLTEQNLRAPVLYWIVKNRKSKKFGSFLKDLVGPRLLNAIFFAIDYEALQTAGTRKIPLAEILSDDPELISDLLENADNESARDLANNLILNQGFEELTKKSILARFIKKFSSVQSLLVGQAEGKDERLIVSQESYDRKKLDYETLVSKKIPEISRAIGVAREHGDLKENSEYKMAKQEQALLLAKKELLENDLGRAQISNFREAPVDQIGIGSVAGLRVASTNQKVTYTILGAWDSDPENQILSYETPLAKSLLGKRVGEQITLSVANNEETWLVESIDRYAQ
jgi:transcription elongation GreA/GreB family factor